MATSLLVTPETKVASLVKLATESHGIPVTATFWLRLPEADYPSIALVIPLADKLGTREVYGRVMAALTNETFAPKSFLQSRLAVFGERESKEAISALRAHRSLVSKIDHYRNVEIEEIPAAESLLDNGILHIMPMNDGHDSALPFQVTFGNFGASEPWMKPRIVRSESELMNLFDHLKVRAEERARLLRDLTTGRSSVSLVLERVPLRDLYEAELL